MGPATAIRVVLATIVIGAVAVGCAAAAPEGAPTEAAAPDASTSTGPSGPVGGTRPAPGSFGFGRPAMPAEIAAWDRDVGPDGVGLPPGSATVTEGLEVYAARCAVCHGVDGTGGPNDVLAGRLPDDGFPFATDAAPYTVGSYWPYATTLFDYVRKAMPFDAPGSMSDLEVYGAVAAVLLFNDLVDDDAVVDADLIASLRMPSRDRFVPDDRTGGPVVR
ncbi:MAG: c-type cytochrome [Gemmatimonadota bacterium]|nr:c-type cytochrome [Gemmatimonadota bacterium]